MFNHPLVSVVLIAYNQERYIREAVEGLFSQTYSPLEIVLSDDGSPDQTFEIIQEMAAAYHGPHKLILNRNEKNLGIAMHFNKVMELAAGEIIALAAGDDISLRDRIADSVRILCQHPDLTCVSLKLITFHGKPSKSIPLDPQPERIHFVDLGEFLESEGGQLFAPSRAFRRFAHDYFGPLSSCSPSEDTANLFRCLLHGKGAESSVPGVRYRIHGNNTWSSANKLKTSVPNLLQELESALRIAHYKGLIDFETCCLLHKKVKRRMGKLSAVLELERSGFSFSAFVRYYLASRHFSFRQKMGHIHRSIRTLQLR